MSLFFFNDTATTEIYTLSLHDALPISQPSLRYPAAPHTSFPPHSSIAAMPPESSSPRRSAEKSARAPGSSRSEEHTSELQSQSNLVCRLLLEKKNEYAHVLLTLMSV